MSEEQVREKINAIMQLVNLEMQAEARKAGKQVDAREKIRRMREKLEAAGLPLPDHLKETS